MGETGIHVQSIITLFQLLTTHFRKEKDVAVIANILFYYQEGDPKRVISPDDFVTRGVGNHLRRTYKLWNELPPDVVFEISSRGTRQADLKRRFELYQGIGVKEYYVFDPEYDYLGDEPLRAFRAENGVFRKVAVNKGRVYSPSLGLELVDTGKALRLFDPISGELLKTYDELDESYAETTAELGEMQAELVDIKAENERLRAEVEKLRKS